jgi:hypothetical protein
MLGANSADVNIIFPKIRENFEKYDDLIMDKPVKYLIQN